MTVRILHFGTLVALLMCTFACTSTVTQDGITLTDEQAAKLDQPIVKINAMEERIKKSLAALDYRRGSALLREIQFLVKIRELAVPQIVERIPESAPRTQASMLYVLGFARSGPAGETLVRYLDDEDNVVRYEAAAGLLHHGDMAAIPVLMNFLEAKDKPFRYKAVQALRQGTGKNFGYEFSAPAATRHAALQRWQSWWEGEKGRLMVRSEKN
ncbi:MAG: HEAT repeat domain-containing protein [Planctomycetota bacterium]